MADPELRIRGKFDESGIEKGAEAAEASIDQLAAEMQEAAAKAAQSFDKLGATEFGPKIEGQLKRTAYAVVELRERVEAARAAGAPVSPDIEAKLAAYESQLEKVATRVSRVKDETADMGDRSKVLAGDLGALKASVGSVGSVFESLDAKGKGVTKTIGELGVKAGLVWAAWELGTKVGQKVEEGLRKVGIRLDDLFLKFGQFVGIVDKTTAAQDRMGVSAQSAVGQQNRLSTAIERAIDPLKELVPGLESYIRSQKEASAEAGRFSSAMERLHGIQGFDAEAFTAANAEALSKYAEKLERIPGAYAKLSDQAREVLENAKELARAMGEASSAAERLEDGVHGSRDALTDLNGELGNTASLNSYGSALDEIERKLEDLQKTVQSGALTDPAQFEAAAAQVRALAKEHDALSEKIRKEADDLERLTTLSDVAPSIDVVREALGQMAVKLGEAAEGARQLNESDPSKALMGFGEVAEANREKLTELVELAKQYGLEVPAAFTHALEAAKSYTDELERVADAKDRLRLVGVEITAALEGENAATLENIAAMHEAAAGLAEFEVRQRAAAAASREHRETELDLAQAHREAAIAAERQAGSIENVTATMRAMSHAVEPASSSIYDASEAIRALLAQVDKVAAGSPMAAQINEWINLFKTGALTSEQLAAGLEEIRRGANTIAGFGGGGAIGDVNTVINTLQSLLSKVNQELKSSGGPWKTFGAGATEAAGGVDKVRAAMAEFWKDQRDEAKATTDAMLEQVQRYADGVQSIGREMARSSGGEGFGPRMRGVSITAINGFDAHALADELTRLDPLATRNRGMR